MCGHQYHTAKIHSFFHAINFLHFFNAISTKPQEFPSWLNFMSGDPAHGMSSGLSCDGEGSQPRTYLLTPNSTLDKTPRPTITPTSVLVPTEEQWNTWQDAERFAALENDNIFRLSVEEFSPWQLYSAANQVCFMEQ